MNILPPKRLPGFDLGPLMIACQPLQFVIRNIEERVVHFQPACLEFYASDRAVRTASSEPVRQPIYSDALEHWKHYELHLLPLKDAIGAVLQRYRA